MNEVLAVLFRGSVAFFTLLILMRFLGKQQISRLTYFDYIVGITLGSIAGRLTVDLSMRAWPQWTALIVWAGLALFLQGLALKWRSVGEYLDGQPTVVIMNGKVMEAALRRMRYRLSDLQEQLRVQGVFDLGEVEFAVLETNGKLSVLKKSQYQPVTPKDLSLPTAYKGLSSEIIYDGVVVDANLEQAGLDRNWLRARLTNLGIKDPSEVFLASLDTSGNLYVDAYKDRLKSPSHMAEPGQALRPKDISEVPHTGNRIDEHGSTEMQPKDELQATGQSQGRKGERSFRSCHKQDPKDNL